MSGNMQMPMPQQMPLGFPRPNGQAARWETRPQNSMPQQMPLMQQPGILDRIAAQTPAMTHPSIAMSPQFMSLLGYQGDQGNTFDAGGP